MGYLSNRPQTAFNRVPEPGAVFILLEDLIGAVLGRARNRLAKVCGYGIVG
jgi:hypothetical protein